MRAFRTEGIIIKRRDYGEADRLLTVFTKEEGKVLIKATGVRKITSRRSAHVEPLNYSQLSLYKGRTLSTLTEAQTLENFSAIKSDLSKIGYAYHICELVDGLCPEGQENLSVFFLLKETLEKLAGEEEILPLIHGFEVELLTLLGYWNTSYQEEDTHVIIEDILERRLKSRRMFSKMR